MRLQRVLRAFVQKIQHVFRVERAEQDAGVLLHDAQQGVIIAALIIGLHGVQVLPVLLVPRAEAAAAVVPALLRQGKEHAERALLHHMMKAENTTVCKIADKGIFFCHRGKNIFCILHVCNCPCHLCGKFICQSHHCQKILLLLS